MTEKEKQEDQATFQATFPGTQNAIAMHGGGGMRIILEIPESEMPNAIDLIAWRDRNLKVTVEVLPKQPPIGGSWR
jgi:hypothetical protein